MELTEFVAGQIWLQEYPVRYAGCDFNARMAVIRISDAKLMLHSPCEIDAAEQDAKATALEAWKGPLAKSLVEGAS